MLRAASGTKSLERNGQMYFEDPRSTFRLGDDHKIMVEFEWTGPVGLHHFQGMWKDPGNNVVSVGRFDFTAQNSPFAAYFTLLIDETAPTGIWGIEARIDGETAGTYSFEIVPADAPLPAAQPAPRVPPTTAEVYKQAQAATVFVEKLDEKGRPISRGSGFFVEPRMLLTTFENIDGASGLRVLFPDGRSETTNQILAWDRWQDWAIVRVNAADVPALKPVPQKSWNVGDRCYSLGISAGGRTIIEGGILGDVTQPRIGERLTVSFASEPSSLGSPLLNEFGDVVGMLGGELLPGLQNSEPPSQGGTDSLPAPRAAMADLAVPILSVKPPSTGQAPSALADLRAKGLFLRPLETNDEVAFATLSSGIDKRDGGPGMPRDWRNQFSLSDRQMFVFINWNPKRKYKGVASVHFFDLDNKELAQSSALKVNLQPDNFTRTYWTVPLNTFVPGAYRVDVYLGDAPAWRQYFRITP